MILGTLSVILLLLSSASEGDGMSMLLHWRGFSVQAAQAASDFMISWITKWRRVVFPSVPFVSTSLNNVSNMKALASP
jgi:hypothetical protein